MAHIAIEYVIMVPVLILQIFLLPLTTNWIMSMWTDNRRTLALQDAASHLGSTIQQLYFTLNEGEILNGTVTLKSPVPPLIDSFPYVGNATLRTALDPILNSSKILELTLTLQTLGTTVHTLVILGQNVEWQNSTFVSNSLNAGIKAEKIGSGTDALIRLSFTS
ncbi:MAG: hypothetical protein ACPL0C_02655 [Candidatus Bathyarchaeales archaeon]